MRVLVVARWYPSYDDPAGGIFVADHCSALASSGVDVRVAAWDPVPLLDTSEADAERLGDALASRFAAAMPFATPGSWGSRGIPVARLPLLTRPPRADRIDESTRVGACARSLLPFGRALAARWPLDLIQAHTGLPDGAAAVRLASDLRVPLATLEHESTLADRLSVPGARDLYRSLFGDRRDVLAVSHSLAARVTAAMGIPADAMAVVPNPVAVADFPLGGVAERDPAELLWVGRRRPSKGIDTLLAAFALVRRDRPGLHLRMVGSASTADDERWRRMADDLGIGDAVSFEAAADRLVIAAAMRRAAVFVHPSPSETFGVVAAEALASGVPVACTPSGGVEEIVGSDGACGEIARGSGAAELAAAIERLLERRLSIDPEGLRARVEARYAPTVVAGLMLARYARLLHEPGHAERGRRTLTPPAAGAIGSSLPDPLPLVVAFRRPNLDRLLPRLPAGLAERMTALTAGSPDDSPDPSSRLGSLIVVDEDRVLRERLAPYERPPARGETGRTAWLLRHPIAVARRRWISRARARNRLDARRAALRGLIRDRRADGRAGITFLSLDAADRNVVEPFASDDVTLAPAGLRWLADAWDERDQRLTGPP